MSVLSGSLPYSCTTTIDGNVQFPDGTVLTPSGYMKYPDGAIHVADARGSYRLPDGSMLLPDMSISFADGSRIHPNGLIQSPGDPMGTVIATPAYSAPIAPVAPIIQSAPFGTTATLGGSVTRIQTITPQVISTPLPVMPTIPGGGSVIRETILSTPTPAVNTSGFNIMDLPPGTIQLAGGAYRIPNGCVLYPEGTVKLPDGSLMQVDGTVMGPNGQPMRPLPDGSYKLRDGTFLLPDGTIRLKNNRIKLPDGSIQLPGSYGGAVSTISATATPLPAITSTVTRSAGPLAIMAPPSGTVESVGQAATNLPNGMMQYPDGTLFLPSTGVTRLPDGNVKLADGTISVAAADGSHRLPNGSILKPDNSIVFADGATLKMDGAVVLPDGAVISQEGGLQQAPKHTNNVFAQPPSAMYPAKVVVDPELLKISQMQPDGSVRMPNGMTLLTDGRVRLADGCVKYVDGRLQSPQGQFKEGQPDGYYKLADGSVLRSDGGLQYPDGSIKCMDNTLVKPDGTLNLPDGTTRPAGTPLPNYDVPAFQYPPRIPVGSVQLPDGSYKLPNGCIQYFDGCLKLLNGNYRLPDGRVVRPDGATATYLPDGAVKVSEDADFLPDLNTRFKDGAIKQPDGCVRLPPPNHNSVQLPTGVIKPAPFALPTFPMPIPTGRTDADVKAALPRESTKLYPGCYKLPSGVLRLPDGSFVLPSYTAFAPGTVALPDGGVWFPDGSSIKPDGTRVPGPGGDNNTLGLYIKMVDDPRTKAPLSRVGVHAVEPGSSGARAGVMANDILTTWNGNQIGSANDFMTKLRAARTGEQVMLGFERNGMAQTVPIQVEAKRARAAMPPGSPVQGGMPAQCTMGAQIEMLDDPATGARQSIVNVVSTDPGGPADRARITRNDRLIKWNQDPLNSYAVLQNKLATSRPGEKVALTVQRGGQLFGADMLLGAAGGVVPAPPAIAAPNYSPRGVTVVPPPPVAAPAPAMAIGGGAAPVPGQTPTLGLMIKMIDDRMGNKNAAVCVHDVTPGGPAERASIRKDDIIAAWNDDPLNSFEKFSSKLQASRIGETVRLKVDRGGQLYQSNAVIEAKPLQVPVASGGGNATMGLSIRMVDDQFGNKERRVLVHEVVPGGAADRGGVMKDDVLVAWNNEPLNSYDVFARKVQSSVPGDRVTLQIDRRGQLITSNVVMDAKPGATASPPAPVVNLLGMGVTDTGGRVQVKEVTPNGPAANARIVPNDYITHWDNEPMTLPRYSQKLAAVRPGENISLTVQRGTQSYGTVINLGGGGTVSGTRSPEPKPVAAGGIPWIGFAVKSVPSKGTILVKDVAEGGPASKAGLKDGDELIDLNGERTSTMDAFRAAVKRHAQVGRTLTVNYARDDQFGRDNAIRGVANIVVEAKTKEVVANVPPLNTPEDIRAVLTDPRKMEIVNRAAWSAADEDMSGFITRQEFAHAMDSWLSPEARRGLTQTDFENMFEAADVDRSNMLVRSEFPIVMEDLLNALARRR